ncbi:hypothetical protein HU200_017748 [Digitaria exilis]|uniref:Uncharacterized protein n=1 Tax=Digitaria exilis TaxID=1010633 RepID=A0A835F6B0_9POAL|nr:hypothetical protein HU200_017748 [Digitaria exilis]
MQGLGIGAFTLDWATVSSYLFSPLISPFFATVNIFFGYVLFVYVMLPIAYWGFNLYNTKTFPIFSTNLFMSNGTIYDITSIVNDQFMINMDAYSKAGKVNLSIFFALCYGLSFATITATVTHVGIFYGKEIYQRFRASRKEKPDIHTRLMKKYDDIPGRWFYSLMALSISVSLLLCTILKHEVQLPWWGLIFALGMAFIFTLPISIITATTNQAIAFLSDFKLGHYMKIPPKSMFLVQWWVRYNYILSAALDAGVAFMGVVLYFSLTMEMKSIHWWGITGEHCPLASCPTAKGVNLGTDSICPVF